MRCHHGVGRRNLGSQVTMKYPAVYMMEPGAQARFSRSPSPATDNTGRRRQGRHGAPHTTSRIISKSISKDGGRSSYRGLLRVANGRKGCKCNVVCDALILDDTSRSDTYPYIEIDEDRRHRSATRPPSARSATSSSST
ncbi:MAG: hypothetical protein KatS3mg051_0551 [Anaerolineae bacterium]|nr:MAG: hypothetical protein KatS3mg051_0551 [Anaerolineae bacterium]